MDFIKQELDQLMGKDRNKPLFIRIAKRDHFDDQDICKFNLLSFCPNDLFPNTKADIGPCEKRHDDFLKDQYMRDPEHSRFERRYQEELIQQLEFMISQVDQKIKRSLQRAENGPMGRTEQVEQTTEMNQIQSETVHEKIDQLDQKIQLFNEQAERLGADGKIEETEALLEEIEKFKKQKSELEALVDNTLVSKDKNMKVCEVCGALQSALDTDKRLTMHLEGKLHTGYLKIRNKLAELKQKRNRDRSSSPRRDSRVRSRAPEKQEDTDLFDQRMIFSSRKYGSGMNIPSGLGSFSFAEIAIQKNKGYAANEQGLGITNLGKEWRWYKKELDNIRRKAKKDLERKQQLSERQGYHERGNTDRSAGNYSRDRREYPQTGGAGYRDRKDDRSHHQSSFNSGGYRR